MAVQLLQHDAKDLEVMQKRLSVPLSKEDLEALEKIATREKRSMGAQAALILEGWLEKNVSDRTNSKGAK
jgi:RNase H-fold protein (predicted Holliday junction resolvase)